MRRNIHIMLVGAGMANTFVLARFTSALVPIMRSLEASDCFNLPEIKITLVSADRNFGSGVAYASDNSCFLLNTPIALIEPQREFREWLEDHLPDIIRYIQAQSGQAWQAWLQKNLNSLQQGDYAEINLPRVIYGMFLQAQLGMAGDRIKQLNERYGTQITLELLKAKVTQIQRESERFILSLADDRVEKVSLVEQANGGFEFPVQSEMRLKQPLVADLVSLGIGLIPVQYPQLVAQPGYFPSVYEPGMATVAEAILKHPASPIRVVLLGTKAAALDVIYYIEHQPQLRARVRLQAISTSGQTRTPAQFSNHSTSYLPTVVPAVFPHLNTAAAFVESVKQEIAVGEAAGYTRLEIWRSLLKMGYLKIARQHLPLAEKQKLDWEGQAELQKITSFTDLASSEAFEHLRSDGILSIVSGKICSLRTCLEGSYPLFYVEVQHSSGMESIAAEIVINCLGTSRLHQSHHPLVNHLIAQSLMVENESGLGVRVNQEREASNNFFVVGALTSGGALANCRGELEFHLARQTMPFVLEDATVAGKTIAHRLRCWLA
jgi:uncharacterized NAD(P)/FAD-binding protein YdhS